MGRRLLLGKGGHCVRVVREWLTGWTLRGDGIRGLRVQRIAGVVGVHPAAQMLRRDGVWRAGEDSR